MPNHVTSRCTVTGDSEMLTRFRDDLFNPMFAEVGEEAERRLFDFAKIVPVPAAVLGTEESSVAKVGAELVVARAEQRSSFFGIETSLNQPELARIVADVGSDGHFGDIAQRYLMKHPEYEAKGLARLRAIVETGFASWYEWNIANWGTKWGAYSVDIVGEEPSSFVFKFETAWSFPTPIFERLVELYPRLTFDLVTFDEGWNFAGHGQIGAVATVPFEIGKATDELYEAVYGHAPEREEDA